MYVRQVLNKICDISGTKGMMGPCRIGVRTLARSRVRKPMQLRKKSTGFTGSRYFYLISRTSFRICLFIGPCSKKWVRIFLNLWSSTRLARNYDLKAKRLFFFEGSSAIGVTLKRSVILHSGARQKVFPG